MIRLYELEDESYYVVRRVDGTPLAVPAWMTRPEAAHANVVPTARLPVRVLLELRRLTVTCLFSPVQNVEEQWMQALTKMSRKEESNEQDHR